jgi:hypothetical protein
MSGNSLGKAKSFAIERRSQSLLCVCNDGLFDSSVSNGVYGFPHGGSQSTKSFWRTIAGICAIGADDLVFLYRTKGDNPGCRCVNGAFKVFAPGGSPAVYYDPDSRDLEMKINGETDCRTRFLFEKLTDDVSYVSENYELVKRLETKELWGFRHPAVMNIGAARKKSIVTLSHKQTLVMLNLLDAAGKKAGPAISGIPPHQRVSYYNSLTGSPGFRVDEAFLLTQSTRTQDEAFMYAYLAYALRHPNSSIHGEVVSDLAAVNEEVLAAAGVKTFEDMTANVLMEVVVSTHLQEELDMVLLDKDENILLLFEIKRGPPDQASIDQARKYLDFLDTIFPGKKSFANIVGEGQPKANLRAGSGRNDRIAIASFDVNSGGRRRISPVSSS